MAEETDRSGWFRRGVQCDRTVWSGRRGMWAGTSVLWVVSGGRRRLTVGAVVSWSAGEEEVCIRSLRWGRRVGQERPQCSPDPACPYNRAALGRAAPPASQEQRQRRAAPAERAVGT